MLSTPAGVPARSRRRPAVLYTLDTVTRAITDRGPDVSVYDMVEIAGGTREGWARFFNQAQEGTFIKRRLKDGKTVVFSFNTQNA